MKIYRILVTSLIVLSGCILFAPTHYGSRPEDWDGFPENPISVREAIVRAQPYIARSVELRSKLTVNRPKEPSRVHVTLRGNYYHIVKENCPSYSPGFYEYHSVRVHKNTGKVISPK